MDGNTADLSASILDDPSETRKLHFHFQNVTGQLFNLLIMQRRGLLNQLRKTWSSFVFPKMSNTKSVLKPARQVHSVTNTTRQYYFTRV